VKVDAGCWERLMPLAGVLGALTCAECVCPYPASRSMLASGAVGNRRSLRPAATSSVSSCARCLSVRSWWAPSGVGGAAGSTACQRLAQTVCLGVHGTQVHRLDDRPSGPGDGRVGFALHPGPSASSLVIDADCGAGVEQPEQCLCDGGCRRSIAPSPRANSPVPHWRSPGPPNSFRSALTR